MRSRASCTVLRSLYNRLLKRGRLTVWVVCDISNMGMVAGEGCPGYPAPMCRRLYWRGLVYRRSHRGVYRWGSYASLSSGNVLRARYLVLVLVLVLGNVQRSRMLSRVILERSHR
jgi:hypothetical protein